MPNKYHARKVTLDGITFDSLREGDRYCQLRLLERAGTITGLQVHKRYILQEAFRIGGQRVRAIYYEADFAYQDGGREIAEDVKGGRATRTQAFEIKRKMFLYKYPDIELRIIET